MSDKYEGVSATFLSLLTPRQDTPRLGMAGPFSPRRKKITQILVQILVPALGTYMTAFSQFSRRAGFTLPSCLSHPMWELPCREALPMPREGPLRPEISAAWLSLLVSLPLLISLRLLLPLSWHTGAGTAGGHAALHFHPVATTDSTPRVLLTSSPPPAQCFLPDST